VALVQFTQELSMNVVLACPTARVLPPPGLARPLWRFDAGYLRRPVEINTSGFFLTKRMTGRLDIRTVIGYRQ